MLSCANCASDPVVRVLHGEVVDDELRMVVQTAVHAVNFPQGERDTNVKQYLVVYRLAGDERADLKRVDELPAPDVIGGGRFVISKSLDSIVRVRDVGAVGLNKRVYSKGIVEVPNNEPARGSERTRILALLHGSGILQG